MQVRETELHTLEFYGNEWNDLDDYIFDLGVRVLPESKIKVTIEVSYD